MKPIATSWCLSGLFFFVFLVSGAITYVPGNERFAQLLGAGLALASVSFAAIALALPRIGKTGYAPFLESRGFSAGYAGFAAILTILILLLCGG